MHRRGFGIERAERRAWTLLHGSGCGRGGLLQQHDQNADATGRSQHAVALITESLAAAFPRQCLQMACAVTRRRFPVGASPTRQPLQPEATGAAMEATKWLKPSDSGSRLGDLRECTGRNASERRALFHGMLHFLHSSFFVRPGIPFLRPDPQDCKAGARRSCQGWPSPQPCGVLRPCQATP
jgi:hypothetical protein